MIRWLKNSIDQTITAETMWFDSWRAQVFKTTMLLVVLLGIIPYALGMYWSFHEKEYSVIIANTLLISCIAYIVFAKGIPISYRVYAIVSMSFLLGVSLLLLLGMRGSAAGSSYLIGFSVLSALLLGMRGAIRSLIVLALFIVSVGLGLHFKIFGSLAIAEFHAVLWLAESINILAVSTLSSIPLVILVRGLENTIGTQQNLQHQLEDKVKELNLAKIKAEEADQLKTKFLANMSHEIRTPLNSIMGFSELVINDLYTDDTEKKEYLNTINKSGSYLLSIIENVLDFSMIESNQLKHSILPVNLNGLLADINNIYHLHNLSKPTVSIIIEFDSSKQLMIKSDCHRLKQVFINLINNSLKFTYHGAIRAGYEVYDSEVVCFVRDTGIGISEDDLKIVFERFVKIEGKHQMQQQGTGLGLPICKGIIETMGGKMWVESELEVGSCFYFSIPL